MEIGSKSYNICQRCILIDGPFGVKVNAEGLCSYCADPTFTTPTWKKVMIKDIVKKEKLEDWYATIKHLQQKYGSQQYSCVLGYSGGKDSTALLDTYVNEYHLKPYVVTVDTGFMTDVAKTNITQTLHKMGLEQDHSFIGTAIPTFTKLYRHFFLTHRPQPHGKALTLEICHICTDLIHTILVKEAMKKRLNYVLIGFSPDQIARYFYETPLKDILKDGLPHPSEFKNLLNNDDLEWFLDDTNTYLSHLPRVLYPYHVIAYDEKEILNRIESKGLIKRGKGDPVLTNCHVVKAGLVYDFFRYGGIAYSVQYAELIRQKKEGEESKKVRKEWLRVMTRVGKTILNGKFNSAGMKIFFERIGSSQDAMLEQIKTQVERDPNKEQITRNIELFQNRTLK